MRPMLSALTITLAALCVSGAPAVLRAQGGFEGVITFRGTDDDGKTNTVVQTSKGHKVKIESGGEDSHGAMILDGDSKSMTMIDAREHKAMVMTQQDMEQMASMMGPMMHKNTEAQKPDFEVSFAPTGRSETVAGVKCDVWHGYTVQDGKKHEGEVCMADGVGLALFDMMANNPFMRQNRALNPEYEQFKKLASGGKRLLKITKIENGKATTELEATNVEKRSVSDAELAVPPGYEVQTMGDVMKKLGTMRKPPQ